MSDYTYTFFGGSRPIPVLVPVEFVVDRMVANAERYRILSSLSSRSETPKDLDAEPDIDAPASDR